MAQCRNCEFHNLPGVVLCGRCGASLVLATAAIDVRPPRASWIQKLARRLPLYRYWWQFRIRSDRPASTDSRRKFVPFPSLVDLMRLLIPGWPQIAAGQREIGLALMLGFLVILALSGPIYGSWPGYLLIATACGIHAGGLYHAALQTGLGHERRRLRFLASLVGVALAVYVPASYGLASLVEPISVQLPRPPLERGDVYMIARRGRRLRPGDLVVYQIYGNNVAVRTGTRVELVQGARIDRILAGPGDRVDWTGATLMVNSVPCQYTPLNATFRPGSFALTIPEGCYLIVPSTERGPVESLTVMPVGFWQSLCVVPEYRIQGRVFWRSAPLARVGVPF